MMLKPAIGARSTTTPLPLIEPTVSLHFLLEQGADGDRLAAIHAGQRLQPCRVGHRAFDRHGLHTMSQQPDGAGDPVSAGAGHVDTSSDDQVIVATATRMRPSRVAADTSGGARRC